MMMMKNLIEEVANMVSYILIQGFLSLTRRWAQHIQFSLKR